MSRLAAGTGGKSGAAITASTATGVAPSRMLVTARRLRMLSPPFSAAVAAAVAASAARKSETRGDVSASTAVAGTSAANRTTADHTTRRTG